MARGQYNNRGDGRSNANDRLIGSEVSVVQKQDQGTDRRTSGIVSEILTNSAYHPRGIKVRLVDGTVGRIAGPSEQTDTSTSYTGNMNAVEDHNAEGPQRPSLFDYMVLPLPPPNRAIINAPPVAEWACPACTFVNSGLLPECELCQSERP
jgi:uncharacterized repeat protein (TIGR03833 family)